ncbi:MAG TPA: CsiV family protein [Gammaproteobacteria bacterium]
MMSRTLAILCHALPVALASGVATAQTTAGSDEELLQRYQIEIIAFAYEDFDPLEETFAETRRGTLLDLLAPNLFETPRPDNHDAAAVTLEPLPEPALSLPGALAIEPIPLQRQEDPAPEGSGDAPAAIGIDDFATDPDFEASVGEIGEDSDPASIDSFDEEPALPEPDILDQGWYRLMRSDDYELVDALRRLERLDAYTPLAHGGWIQEGLAEEDAIPFDLSLFGVFNPRGSVRLHVSRFLHVTVDLEFRPPFENRRTAPMPSAPLAQFEFPPRFVLKVQRRVRSGELHFFDHPAFGVLVLVQPAPETAEVVEDDVSPAA